MTSEYSTLTEVQKEKRRIARRKYYENNKERLKAANRRYHSEGKRARPVKSAAQKETVSQSNRSYYISNRSRLLEKSRQYHKNNPDVRSKWERSNSQLRSEQAASRKYGISTEEVRRLRTANGGVCECCGIAPPIGSYHAIDHCHATGAIRGLLCRDCNLGIGLFKDSPELLRAAAAYIERFKP